MHVGAYEQTRDESGCIVGLKHIISVCVSGEECPDAKECSAELQNRYPGAFLMVEFGEPGAHAFDNASRP